MKTTAVGRMALAILCGVAAVSLASSVYQFDGPRNPQAVVDETATQYTLQVQMLPVSAFDPPTNEKLTLAKSRSVAFMALARHLKIPPTSELSVAGLQITDKRMDGSSIVVQIALPKSGVKISPRAERVPAQPMATGNDPATQPGPIGSSLLTRVGDYQDSARELRDIFVEQLNPSAALELTDERIADLEQAIAEKFEMLGKAMDADMLLLTVERDELRPKIKAMQDGLLEQLRQAVNMRAVSSMVAEEPFASCLKADPILLQVGGSRIVMLPETNRSLIVSVASTAVKDNFAADRVRMQKVCRSKALAELLSQEKGLQVKYALRAEDKTVIVFQNGNEETASLESTLETTSARVEGFVHALPVVATWYSAGGDMYYLAIGTIVGHEQNQGDE